ncbi:MAG: DUF2461 domain-containing protein [Bacteroidia bacterium]|nr:DUF2461 domain-containing protein [Bacteroidia bacterium]
MSISKNTIKFLKDLKKNNNREWFNDNKSRYNDAKDDFTNFVAELIPGIAKFDKEIKDLDPKKCVFRIYRDVRFSKNKDPYKTNLGAHMLPGGRKTEHSRAGYYIHLEPGKSILAGGPYMPPGPWINAIRSEIDYNTKEFKKIINAASFKKYFGEIEGDKLKTAPKGYPKDHPEIELLKFKSYLAVHNLKDKDVVDAKFKKHAMTVFKAMQPFDKFLNRSTD